MKDLGKWLGGIALAAMISASATAESFNGFGQDIPLESAARQIIPEGWTVDFGEGVDKSAPVSWASAKDWKSALTAAVGKKGYAAQFGSSSVVIVKSGRFASAPTAAYSSPKASATKKTKKVSTSSVSSRRANAVEREVSGGGGFVIARYRKSSYQDQELATKGEGWKPYAGKNAEGEPSDSVFTVKEGDDLRRVLVEWGDKTGWKVIWKSEFSYPIVASASFGGGFVEAATALVNAMDDVRPIITVDFYKGNQVVVVTNGSAGEAN